MAIRSLVVAIRANTAPFSRGVASVVRQLTGLEAKTRKTGRSMRFAFGGIGAGLGGLGAGLAGGAGLAKVLGLGEDFQQAMNHSLAIMSNVTPQLRARMEDVALSAARMNKATSAQAAEGLFHLASAGLSAEQSIAALPVVARFATAGMFNLAQATELLLGSQSALGLSVDDSTANMKNMVRVADALVAANIVSQATVEEFAQALASGPAAEMRALGRDVEETLAVLAAFAKQNIRGAEAGTQMSIVLRDLQTKALENAKAFRRARIAVFDGRGEFRRMADVVEDIENRLQGMSDKQRKATLMQLGFADRSLKSITMLLGMSSVIRDYEKDIRDLGGVTDSVAVKQLTSWEKFTSSANVAATRISRALKPLTDDLVSLGEGAAESFGRLAEWAEQNKVFDNSVAKWTTRVLTGALALGALARGAQFFSRAFKFFVFPVVATALKLFRFLLPAIETMVIGLTEAVRQIAAIDAAVAVFRIWRGRTAAESTNPGRPSPFFQTGQWINTKWAREENERQLDMFRPGSRFDRSRRGVEELSVLERLADEQKVTNRNLERVRQSIEGFGAIR